MWVRKRCRFLQTYGGDGPFAAMVSFPGPHCPYDPNQEFLDEVDPQQMPAAIPAVPGDADELLRNNVEGNSRPWNGVDYSTFTDAQKQKVRAHYAASVNQIDVEIGRIMATLKEEGLAREYGRHLHQRPRRLPGRSWLYRQRHLLRKRHPHPADCACTRWDKLSGL